MTFFFFLRVLLSSVHSNLHIKDLPQSFVWKAEVSVSIWLKLATRNTCSSCGSLPMDFSVFMSTFPTPMAKIRIPELRAFAAISATGSCGRPSVTIMIMRGTFWLRGRAPSDSENAMLTAYWIASPVMVPVARCIILLTALSISCFLLNVFRENSCLTVLPYWIRPTRVASGLMSRNCKMVKMNSFTFSKS